MRRRLVIVAAVAAVLALAWWWLGSTDDDRPHARDDGGLTHPIDPDGDDERLPADESDDEPWGPRPGERSDGEQSDDDWLAPTAPSVDEDAGSYVVEGLVVDENDLPTPGALVTTADDRQRRSTTGLDGTFVIEGLSARPISLVAREGNRVSAERRVTPGPDAEPVVLRLEPGMQLELTVRDDDSGAPVPGARVVLHENQLQRGVTDADGVVRFEGFVCCYLLLTVEAAGYELERVTRQLPQGAPQPVTEEVRLRRGAELTGVVRAVDGRPLPDSRVELVRDDEPYIELPNEGPRGVLTDAAGRFRIASVAEGAARLLARHDRFQPGYSDRLQLDGVTPAGPVEITLEPGASISGWVLREDGEPAPYARLLLRADDGRPFRVPPPGSRGQFAEADGEGRFTVDDLPPVAMTVRAMGREGGTSDKLPLDLSATPQRYDLELVLREGGQISGMVVDQRGEPVPDAWVTARWLGSSDGSDDPTSELEPGEERPRPQVDQADEIGQFEVRGLAPGRWSLRARRLASFGVGAGPAVEARVGDRGVTLELPDNGRLAGQVVFPDGSSPESFRLTLSGLRDQLLAPPDGRFEVEVPAGEFVVMLRGDEFRSWRTDGVQVRAGETTDLGELLVEPGRTIAGRVFDPHGAPVADATVTGARVLLVHQSLSGADALRRLVRQTGSRFATTDASGRFEIRGLSDTGVTVMAEHPQLGRSRPVRVPAGEEPRELELELVDTGSVDCLVTLDGQPLPGATVRLVALQDRPDVVWFDRTASDGRVGFELMPPGDYLAVVSPPRGQAESFDGSRPAELVVEPGERTEVTVDLGQPRDP